MRIWFHRQDAQSHRLLRPPRPKDLLTSACGRVECPACRDTGARSLGVSRDLEIVRCRSCATLYCPRWETPYSYDKYYEGDFGPPPDAVQASLSRSLGSFEPYRRLNRLLDVGFGGAELMRQAARLGWEVQGTEMSDAAVANARSLGLNAFHGPLEGAPFEDCWFDVVTAVEVIEHLDDPGSFLVSVRRLLRPGGLLWITTPHGRGISARLLGLRWDVIAPPEHCQLFSAPGLRRLLAAAGFQPLAIRTQSVNPIALADGLLGRSGRHDRTESSRAIMEAAGRGKLFALTLKTGNAVLRTTGLGDSLRAYAVRP